MADFDAIETAFQTRAESLVVATTGSATLAATATGYSRTTGSFLTDGFVQGMEVTPTGFTQTAPAVITNVTALALTVAGGRTAQGSATGRTLAVGLPALRAYEALDFVPTPNRPYVEASLAAGASFLRTGPAQGGTREDTGLFVVRWYGLANAGQSAIRQAVQALAALFTPGTYLAAGADTVRVRGDNTAAKISNLLAIPGGWVCCTLTVPYRVHSANVVAA